MVTLLIVCLSLWTDDLLNDEHECKDYYFISHAMTVDDPSDQLTLEQVLKLNSKATPAPWRFFAKKGSGWIIIDYSDLLCTTFEDYYLSLKGNAATVEFFYKERDATWRSQLSGVQQKDREVSNGLISPSISLKELDPGFPILIRTKQAVIPAMVFERADIIYQNQNSASIITAVLAGGIGLIVIVNLFRWLYHLERISGIYAMYMMTFMLNMICFSGNNTIFHIADLSPWTKYELHHLTLFIAPLMAVLYGILFLRLSAQNRAAIYVAAVPSLIHIISMSVYMISGIALLPGWIFNSNVLLMILTVTIAGIIEWRKGRQYVSLYVVACLLLTFFTLYFIWSRLVNYPAVYVFPIPAFFYGYLIEAILLNLSLNLRIDRDKRQAEVEKVKTLKALAAYEQKQKQLLESMVAERTDELENTLKQLRKTQSQLIQSEKMAALGVLSAGVGHEINNPLNFIQGGIDGLSKHLAKERANDTVSSKLISIVREGVHRATFIVDNLIQFSRASKSKNEDCNINQIIDNCLIALANRFMDRIEIVRHDDNNKIQLHGNKTLLRQAFMNVLNNAEQAIDGQGTIRISTTQDSNKIHIEITDDGVGIPSSNLHKILDPFFTTKPPGKGTGLGLSITYKIIEDHRGSIIVHSSEGIGTTVRISLPVDNSSLG